MAEIHRDRYCVLTREGGEPLLRFKRLAEPIRDASELENFRGGLSLAVSLAERGRLSVLMDMRLGPINTGTALDARIVETFSAWTQTFRKRAILVATAVGKLQAVRTTREQRYEIPIFSDEREALAFLHDS